MSQILELPDALFHALQKAAADRGMTPQGWIAALISTNNADQSNGVATPTLAEKFRGRTGRIASGGKENLSEECGQKFTEHLQAKRQAGHL